MLTSLHFFRQPEDDTAAAARVGCATEDEPRSRLRGKTFGGRVETTWTGKKLGKRILEQSPASRKIKLFLYTDATF